MSSTSLAHNAEQRTKQDAAPNKTAESCTGQTIFLTAAEGKRLRQIALQIDDCAQNLDWYKTRRNRAAFNEYKAQLHRLTTEMYEITLHATWREIENEAT